MADTAIADFTDGVTANGTDRIPAARSPFGAGDDRFLTPAYIAEYCRTLTQTFTNKTLTTPIISDPTLSGTGTITGIATGASKLVLDDATGAQLKYGGGALINSGNAILYKNGITTTVTITLASGAIATSGGITTGSTTLHTTSVALTNGAAAATGTLTNAPAAGNPTKWIPINDNGTTRYIPAW